MTNNKPITRKVIFTTALLSAFAAFVLLSPEAFALNAGQEMGQSVQRLENLLQGNLMRAIMIVGLAASLAMSFFKSSVVPVTIGMGAGVLYWFAYTWVSSNFACCV